MPCPTGVVLFPLPAPAGPPPPANKQDKESSLTPPVFAVTQVCFCRVSYRLRFRVTHAVSLGPRLSALGQPQANSWRYLLPVPDQNERRPVVGMRIRFVGVEFKKRFGCCRG